MASDDNVTMRQRINTSKQYNRVTIEPKNLPSKPTRKPVVTGGARFNLDYRWAFYTLLFSHTVAAIWSPILDCDETFNYWEPTHYLTHGHGFQTWEYSPEYALRSWTYAMIHAILTLFGRWLPGTAGSKTAEFYTLRIFLGLICAICETRLFSKISSALNPRIAVTFLIIMATSSGMFHASVAYLPSTFAMNFVMLGTAAFMDWRGGLRTAQAIWCFGIASILGWPFAGVLCLPFLAEEALLGSMSDLNAVVELLRRLLDGTVRSLIVLFAQFCLELFFYKEMFLVPWNIVAYNIFSKKGGPNLYGTEPWHFYLRNLFLNFNLWLPLALAAMPLLLVQEYFRAPGALRSSYLRGIIFLTPFYMWLAIFTLQPHKEERFMYPAYPALAINAAVALHIILANLGSTDPKRLVAKIPILIRFAGILAFVASTIVFSFWRTMGTVTAYAAPLSIYKPLHSMNISATGEYVCHGKEWYRFPSHFLLPNGVRAKFIKSEFNGLLPGEFSEAAVGFGAFPGSWLVPPGMNDENREDPGKYIEVKHCTYLIDSHSPSTKATKLEPDYIHDLAHWEKVKCLPFLDAGSTSLVGRLGWIPDLPFVPARLRRTWGEYCLLRRETARSKAPRPEGMPHLEPML